MRPPLELLRAAGVEVVVHEHAPVATVADVLVALPFPAEEHVKTLAVDAGGVIVLAGLRGSDRVSFGRLARAVGVPRDRVSPLSPDRVRSELGLEPGGVCVLVDRDDVVVLVDPAVLGLRRVYCGSGRTDATLELDPADLVAVARATVVELAADAVATPR